MIINKSSIIPAKLINVDDDGNYHLLCYLGFDNVVEKVFTKELIKERSEYYLIKTELNNCSVVCEIQPADEFFTLIKEVYEKQYQ